MPSHRQGASSQTLRDRPPAMDSPSYTALQLSCFTPDNRIPNHLWPRHQYRHYGKDLLLFDLVNATTGQVISTEEEKKAGKGANKYKSVSDFYEQADADLKDRYEALKDFMLALGDDAQLSVMKQYFAFKRIKNFACVEIHPQTRKLLVYVKVNPDSVDLEKEKGFLRDVRKIGHFGTGDLEITIKSADDFERAKPFIVKSYEVS